MEAEKMAHERLKLRTTKGRGLATALVTAMIRSRSNPRLSVHVGLRKCVDNHSITAKEC